MDSRINELIPRILDQVKDIRHDLHRHPETKFRETRREYNRRDSRRMGNRWRVLETALSRCRRRGRPHRGAQGGYRCPPPFRTSPDSLHVRQRSFFNMRAGMTVIRRSARDAWLLNR